MKKYLFIILSLITFASSAQRIAKDFGDVYFDFFQFKEAAEYYEQALADEEKPEKKQYYYQQLSQCYKYTFQYQKAEFYFDKLINSGEVFAYEYFIDYGNILKLNGKYKEAKEQFKKYQEVTNTDLAESFLRSVNWAIRNRDTIRRYEVIPTNLDISGQSLGYCYYSEGLIYAHARNKKTGSKQALIFDLDYVRNVNRTDFEPDVNLLSSIEFNLNEGGPCVSKDGQRLYFYANNTILTKGKPRKVGSVEISAEGVSNFKIYMAQNEGGIFKFPIPLSFNSDEYSCIHPCLSDDGKTLFFSSNKDGGFGGFDLYKTTIGPDGMWAEPVNLGKNVNTEENEIFPFVNSGMLYFSSKGFNGYGGYDIFIAKLNKINMPTALKNFGQPINSYRDDVAMITKDDGYSGYFSSNRENEEGSDNVFYFKDVDPERFFQLYGKKDTTAILSASLLIIDSIPENIPTIATNLDSSKAPLTASIPVVDKPKVNEAVVLPIPVVVPQVKPATAKPTTKPVVTPFPVDASQLVNKRFTPVYFEFDKYGINQNTMQSADSVAHILKQSKSLKVYITAHTDSRGDFEYNINLSEKRAATVKKYLIQKGVPANQIISRGLGESEPVNECSDDVNCTEEQHAKNRRVELKIVK